MIPEAFVATSRRRERELARRRFERRRQAELERRARAKRRNTVVGAVVATIVVLGAVVGGGFALFGGSSKPKPKALKPGATPSASASPSATPAPPAPKKCATISPNPPAKGDPMVPDVTGKAPTKLVKKDIKVGHGAVAKAGQKITVKYVGISCSNGQAFDASYTDGAKNQEFSFTLGKGAVIAGWDQGIPGMRVGGERELIIPASLGYHATGSPPKIAGNETLIFDVTLVKV
jgi:peptidylprolyl isomerase